MPNPGDAAIECSLALQDREGDAVKEMSPSAHIHGPAGFHRGEGMAGEI